MAPPTRMHTLAYDADGALQTRTQNEVADGMEVQRIETFAYDAFELIHRYTVRRDVAAVGAGLGCAADAAQQPMDDWRYRFGPLQEREQKRQYATAGNAAVDGLRWTYTLLGADAKQLATYNGLQGAFCGQPDATVWMWPVEHNAWGPAGTRVIMRPTGAREYVVHDHLGSARLTLDNTGQIVERRSYRAFGTETSSAGEGARTSYIGREKDVESDLGFYGVRMYEPTYGRFLSVDPLWGEFAQMTPYHYCGNNPLILTDPSGEFPWGILIGAAVEMASQMAFENRSFSDIDYKRVGVAAVAGGLTGGLSSISSTGARIAATATISVAEGAAKRAVSGEETTAGDVAKDAVFGAAGGYVAENVAKRALASAEGQLAKDQLRRAENAVADGRLRPAQLARAEAAKEALAQVGRGPKQDLLISVGKESADKLAQVVFTPMKKDNTSVSPRNVPGKP